MADDIDNAEMSRRTLAQLLGAGLFGAALSQANITSAATVEKAAERSFLPPPDYTPPKISVLVYPKMVLLDLIGPLTVFSIMQSKVELVWKDRSLLPTDCLVGVTPTHDFATAAKSPDVFLIPGGINGTVNCMNDPEVLAYVKAQGESAKYVTSVCTGSLVLAAAGLLKGYKATSLWAVTDLLPLMGAEWVDERVVIDRNRITGGGVTAGIDFGLTLGAILTSETVAKRVQLTIEYAPQPPFKAGTPKEAGPAILKLARDRRKGMDASAKAAATAAGKRLGTIAAGA